MRITLIPGLIARHLPLALLSTQSLVPFTSVTAGSTPQRVFSSSAKMPQEDTTNYVAGELTAQTSQRIQDAHNLFGAKPSHAIFQRSWSPDAIFEDPICYAVGERQYKAQWWGMPAAFSRSELLAWHVEKDDTKEIRYVQRQRYHVKFIGITKEMLSTVVMKLNHEGKIIHFQDRWNHQDMPENFIVMTLRRLNALIMPFLISVPPATEGSNKGKKEL